MDIWKNHQQSQVFQKLAVRRGPQISGLAPLGVPCHLTMDITISYLREEQEHVCATASLPSDTYWLRAWKKDVLEKGGIKGLPTASSNFNWHQKKKKKDLCVGQIRPWKKLINGKEVWIECCYWKWNASSLHLEEKIYMHLKNEETFLFKMSTRIRTTPSVIERGATTQVQGQQVF